MSGSMIGGHYSAPDDDALDDSEGLFEDLKQDVTHKSPGTIPGAPPKRNREP